MPHPLHRQANCFAEFNQVPEQCACVVMKHWNEIANDWSFHHLSMFSSCNVYVNSIMFQGSTSCSGIIRIIQPNLWNPSNVHHWTPHLQQAPSAPHQPVAAPTPMLSAGPHVLGVLKSLIRLRTLWWASTHWHDQAATSGVDLRMPSGMQIYVYI